MATGESFSLNSWVSISINLEKTLQGEIMAPFGQSLIKQNDEARYLLDEHSQKRCGLGIQYNQAGKVW